MNSFRTLKPTEITGNVFDLIGDKWMLITAGTPDSFNTMTASWGMMGVLWGKPVATCFVRPQRYTFGFIDKAPVYTLSFYGEEYRKQLQICGTKSGRDIDKVKETGFTPAFTGTGAPYFQEASLVLVVRKLYTDWLEPENFIDTSNIDKWYPTKDFHKIFVGEVTEVLAK